MTVKRRRFLPYAFGERRLSFSIVRAWTEDEVVPLEDLLDPERGVLDLRGFADRAHKLSLLIRAPKFDRALLSQVLPATEHERPPVKLVAVLTDARGWCRRSTPLERNGDAFEAEVTVVLPDSTGELEIGLIAVRTAKSDTRPSAGFATETGMRVASAAPLRVTTREPTATPGGSLDVRWVDFPSSELPQLRRRRSAVFYLESTCEPPILWLNKANPDLAGVLESKGTRGRTAMVRDLLNTTIALPVWYGLFHAASLAVQRDEEGEAHAPEGWRAGFLVRLAPRCFPGCPKASAYTQLLDLIMRARDPDHADASAMLTERTVAALHDELRLTEVTERALKELAKA